MVKKLKRKPDFFSGGYCPDGVVYSRTEYYRSWRKLIKCIEQITGLRCYAYDPDIALCEVKGKTMGPTVHLPLWFGKLLVSRARSVETFPIKSIKKLRYCIAI